MVPRPPNKAGKFALASGPPSVHNPAPRGSTAGREKISDGKEEILEFSLLPELQKVMNLPQMLAYLFAWYLFQITYLQLSIGRLAEGPAMGAADKAITAG